MSHVVDEKRGLSGGERTRRMRRAGFSAAVGRTVTMMVALVATPLLVSALGTSGYGIYATVTSLSAFMALGQLGLGSGLLTVMAARQGEGDESEVRAVAQSAWLLAAGSAILVALLGWCVSLVFDIPALLGAPPALTTSALVSFRIYVIGFAVVMVLGLCGRFQAALQRGSEAALWLAGSAVASMVLGAAMATVSGSIPLAVLGTVTGQFMALGAQTVRFLWQEPLLRPSVTLGGGHAVLLRASGWLLVLEVSAALAFQTDLFVVSALLGSDQAAVYQVTLRLFGLLGLVTAALATQYWPAAAEALAARDPQWVRESLRQTVIVLTDGYTPWPSVPAPVPVIVGVLGRVRDLLPPTPDWVQRVEVVPDE